MKQSILDIINSPENKAELMRIQREMYDMGRVDCMKATIEAFEALADELFTKENVIAALKGSLILAENRGH